MEADSRETPDDMDKRKDRRGDPVFFFWLDGLHNATERGVGTGLPDGPCAVELVGADSISARCGERIIKN